MDVALQVDENRLAGFNVAVKYVRGAFQRHRFAGQHPGIGTAAQAQGPDTEWVPKRQYAMPGDQRNHGIRAFDAPMHIAHSRKNISRLKWQAARGFLDLMREHVEQHLRVTLGIDVPMVFAEQLVFESLGIGQIAVMHQHDAKRRIHVKRLRFFLAVGITGGGVTHLAQATIARQRAHVASAKHIAHHPLGLVHEELALLLGDDTRGILATVLQQQQRVINQLVHRCVADNADDSTH